MKLLEGFGLAMTILERIRAALNDGRETIEVNDLGSRFAPVDDEIQARGTTPDGED